ncbi:MAG: TRAP transporter substrate-binding protein [Salinarimonas sp.]
MPRIATSHLALAAVAAALTVSTALTSPAAAQEVTLRVHHFLPAASQAHQNWLMPWAEKVEADSEGRIAVEIFPAMQLGGRPPQLYDQARDGIVDVVWTLAGNTPGRFPSLEALELPFVPHATGEVTSAAAHEFYEANATAELDDVHVLAVFGHGHGHFYTREKTIERPADVEGMTIRVPNRVINQTLANLGANPQGIPAPGVPEALSRGVVQGVVFPYEVVPALKVNELTDKVGAFTGDRSLYTAIFLFVMNKGVYEGMSAENQAVIDANSGLELARQTGAKWDQWDLVGKAAIMESGNEITMIEGEALEAWKAAGEPVIASWIEEQDAAGRDGPAPVQAARGLVAAHVSAPD